MVARKLGHFVEAYETTVVACSHDLRHDRAVSRHATSNRQHGSNGLVSLRRLVDKHFVGFVNDSRK